MRLIHRIILLVFLLLPAFDCAAQMAVEDAPAQLQRKAQHAKSIEEVLNEIVLGEAQLNALIEDADWMHKIYDAAALIGGSDQLMDLVSQVSEYGDLVKVFTADIERYAADGVISPERLSYSMSVVARGLTDVTTTLTGNVGKALTTPGLTVGERLEMLTGESRRLQKEYWVMMWEMLSNRKKAAAAERSGDKTNAASQFGVDGIEPKPEIKATLSDCNSLVLTDAYTASLYAQAGSKQSRYYSGSADTQEQKAASNAEGLYGNAVEIASYLLGIAAALLLVIAFERRNKGQSQSHDALYKVAIGLLFALVALQVVTKYIHF